MSIKTFDDYGQKTDHPHDPRNSLDDAGEHYESTLAALEAAKGFVEKAIRVLERERYPDIVVTVAMDDAILALGGVPRLS